ncbi:hypothetical protein X989_4713 [Burkholderia pseudomallei MSHR4378]|nr:hypothetical protein X989_4713 [Burkholderia pseudomallei MSHR4378]KGS25140.1 hypothetical protein X941_4832 [Burkholderia pseudomallei MSHR5569]
MGRSVFASQGGPPFDRLQVIAQHVNAAESKKYFCRASQQIREPLRIRKSFNLFTIEQEQLNQLSGKDIANETLPTGREFHILRAVNKYREALCERTTPRPLSTDCYFLTSASNVDQQLNSDHRTACRISTLKRLNQLLVF